MQNSAVIRPFRQEDLGAVMEIWLAANLQAHDFVPAAYWRAHYAEAAEGIAGAEVYVCEEDGRLLGFAGLTGDYLAGLFVRPGEQSRGVGKRLLDRAKRGRERLTLSVYGKNSRAAAFYAREGFVPESAGTEENGETELHLCWQKGGPPAEGAG